jgi:hypothetical protein
MNWTESESNWDRYGMVARQAWDRLTDDELDQLQGEGDYVAARDYQQARHEFAGTQGSRRRDEDA